MNAFSLHGNISVDARKATDAVKDFREHVRGAKTDLEGLAKAQSNDVGLRSMAQASREARRLAQAELALLKEQKRAQDDLGKATKERAKTQNQADSEALKASKQKAGEEKKAIAEVAAARKKADTLAERERKAALSRQKQEGAALAREIEANWRRSGSITNRFGDSVKTVTGHLKDAGKELQKIERNTRDMKFSFKFDPKTSNLDELKKELHDARKAAGAIDLDLNTEKAQAELTALWGTIQKLKKDAKIDISIDQSGSIKKTAITTGTGMGGGGPPSGASGADLIAKARKEASEARKELWQKSSDAASLTGAGMLAGVGLAVKAAVDWESAFAGVAKTVDATDAQLKQLSTDLRQMSTQIPVSAADLAKIAENAGQLGIKTESIKSFTRVMADLSATTNMTADQASTDLAKIANITKMPASEFDRLGATLVDLGNKGASTESEIVAMALRIAGAGSQIGLSNAEIMAFASSLSSVGIEAEAGGSAISNVFKAIDKSVRNGGNSLKIYAQLAGMSGAEFKKAFEEDSASAIAKFVKGLGQIKQAGGDAFGTLDKLGLSEKRTSDALMRLAGDSDQLAANIKTGNQAWQENTALQAEAAKRYATTAAELKVTQNKMDELARTAGKSLLPALNSLLKSTSGLFDWFNKLTPAAQENWVKFTALAGVTLLVGGRIKSLVDTLLLARTALYGLRTAQAAAALATGVTTEATVAMTLAQRASAAATWVFGAALKALQLTLGIVRVVGVTTFNAVKIAAGSTLGVFALIAVAIAGFATAFYGARDAGTMSADALIEKWGILGQVWVAGGDALGSLLAKLDSNNAAGDEAERKSYEIQKKIWAKQGKPTRTFEQFQQGLAPGQTQASADAAAKASARTLPTNRALKKRRARPRKPLLPPEPRRKSKTTNSTA